MTEKSTIFNVALVIGLTIAVAPRIAKILKIFEPMALPMAISFSPLHVATTEAASSGSEVPIATTVNPITASDNFKSFAK